MNEGFWEDEESISEYDMLEDAQETEELAAQYAAQPDIVEAEPELLKEISEESAFELNDEQSNVVYNARLRLEQAKLYEMLINHDLFEGVEADAKAISIVREELKHYIVKRLEILMGLRQAIEPKQEIPLNFNPIEIDFLKQLSYKGTRGASIQSVPSKGLKPLIAPSRASALKPLVGNKKVVKGSDIKVIVDGQTLKSTNRVSRSVQPKRKRLGRPKKNNIKSGVMKQRNLTQDEIENIAREDLELTKGRKPFHKMNAKEKAVEIQRVNSRHAKSKVKRTSSGAIPMMDTNALQMKYLTEQSGRAVATGHGGKGNFNQILANALATQKIKLVNEGE